jgi:hypothetical protein
MYHDGEGVLQDYAEAMKWFRKAADQGDAEAQYALASASPRRQCFCRVFRLYAVNQVSA